MDKRKLAEEISKCSDLITYDEEEISPEEAISEIEDALESSDYGGYGYVLKSKSLIYCEKEWGGSDDILVFEDEEDAEKEAEEYWATSMENDSGLISAEQAASNGFLNKSDSEVMDEWIEGEVEHYTNHTDDALSSFQSLQDKADAWEEAVDKLEEELYEINDSWDEVKYYMKGMKKPKGRPSRDAEKNGEKLAVLLLNENGKKQAVRLMESLSDIDKNNPQEVADLYALLNKVYDVVKDAHDTKDDELIDKKQEAKEWHRDELPELIEEEVKDRIKYDVQVSYNGDMYSYLEMEFGMESDHIIENYFDGIDLKAYAEYIVSMDGAGSMDSYDGSVHESCGLVWLHF